MTKEIKEEKIRSDFVTIASHRLRTPLSELRWTLDSLLAVKGGKLTTLQKDYLKQAYESNQQMIKVVDDLLRVSRLEERGLKLKLKKINPLPLIKKVVQELRPFASANNCQIILKFSAKIPTLYLDEELFSFVLKSLCDNAIRYSHHQGLVEIKAQPQNQDFWLFSVKDDGLGISQAEQKKIFTKFFRGKKAAKGQTEGTGLRLYLTKHFILAQGGKIWFKSQTGKGTVFYFTLPRKKPAENFYQPPLEKELAVKTVKAKADAVIKHEREIVSLTVHELKNPLAADKWNLEILKKEPLAPKQKEIIADLEKNNQRLLLLVSDLLHLAKLEQGKLTLKIQPLVLTPIIQSVLDSLQAVLKERKQIIDWSKKSLPQVLGDKIRLVQVLTNLLSNASKYTPSQGKIFISTEILDKRKLEILKRRFALTHTQHQKGYLLISIRDTGMGISPEQQKKIFSKFFRGKNVLRQNIEGTGLGLYLTKNIVNLHHGDIFFESKVSIGSTFYFTLPLA